MNTHKYTARLQLFIDKHGQMLRAFLCGMLLGTALWNTHVLQGHFLQKEAIKQEQTVTKKTVQKKHSVSSERLRMLQRRAERLARQEQSPIIQKTTVVQATNERPRLVVEELRKAAPVIEEASSSSDVPVVLTIDPVVESSSSLAPRSAQREVGSSTSYSSQTPAPRSAQREVGSSTSYSSQTPAPRSSQSEVGSSTSNRQSFPAFDRAIHPVAEIPNWGNMFTPAEWNRTYRQMTDADFVRVPSYDLNRLTIPLDSLVQDRTSEDSIKKITEKLYFSTRHFGAYDVDATEFTAVHPGVDLKLPEGTPIGSVAGGRVHDVRSSAGDLGKHVLIEHRAPDGNTYYSIYGHLGSVSVQKGDSVTAGQMIGTVGMTGNTSGPHLHLQIDRGEPDEASHGVYWPSSMPSRSEADVHTINPIAFLRQY